MNTQKVIVYSCVGYTGYRIVRYAALRVAYRYQQEITDFTVSRVSKFIYGDR